MSAFTPFRPMISKCPIWCRGAPATDDAAGHQDTASPEIASPDRHLGENAGHPGAAARTATCAECGGRFKPKARAPCRCDVGAQTHAADIWPCSKAARDPPDLPVPQRRPVWTRPGSSGRSQPLLEPMRQRHGAADLPNRTEWKRVKARTSPSLTLTLPQPISPSRSVWRPCNTDRNGRFDV
jgi:hypothetical protein